jgi:methionyl-tRNA synthetase
MKRQKQAQKINVQMKKYLEKNHAIKEALRVFDISYAQYQKTLESGYSYYTDISTSPRRVR